MSIRTHRSAFYVSISFALGIMFGYLGFITWHVWGLIVGGLLIAYLILRRLRTWLMFLIVLSLGAFYFQSSYIFPAEHISFYTSYERSDIDSYEGLVDSAVVTKLTNYGDRKEFEFELNELMIQSKKVKVKGRVLVHYYGKLHLAYGDRLKIQGSIFKAKQKDDSSFSYQQYLEDHHLYFILSVGKRHEVRIIDSHQGARWLEFSIYLKDLFKKTYLKYLTEQEVNMIQAMTLGDKTNLDKGIYKLFSLTGTAHILAISGMNMTVIAAMMLFIFKIIGLQRQLRFMLTVVFLIFYAMMCGWSASVVRSVIMAFFLLSSYALELETDVLNSLGLAAIVILTIEPRSIFDIGFQLSFLCVLTIVIFYPVVCHYVQQLIKATWLKRIVQMLSISLLASLAVMPIIANTFGNISLIGILANLIIVPMADIAIILGLSFVGASFVFPWLAMLIVANLKVCLNLMVLIVSICAQIPGSYMNVSGISEWMVIAYYVVFFLIMAIQLMSKYNIKHEPTLKSV